ncbi:flavin-dependent oxidoreductase, F420-dependent methylene-tetrahydromethanopterin reductase [Frankia sp. EI5c]|uniref:LLM class flavin-dependent oxidoreductase n=1 Tax=Frankia sp. EI5c TaxID=683316 RepID=UPI0007C2E853|nr:LLM class flavin-dependent oxidoreductase [Frankia sp. EI5c]OAA27913.1 flavin-dependent oxidoreductase, F420-dependent methylene-tetrahydromethanopterin reductase [Frankia sp. EI5c]
MQFHLYLPQMRLSPGQLVERARAAEAAGFDGVAGMDHLAPPLAEDQPMFAASVTNTWLAAHTSRLTVGSLVLCDVFRHPAVLAQESVSLDHLSGGRYELGLGTGSRASEIVSYGAALPAGRLRVRRLGETLEILRALWTGEAVDYDGEFFQLRGARQAPVPLGHIPIQLGGAGPKTMELVAAHADWWNVHIGILDKLDEMRAYAGRAQVSMQVRVAFVPSEDQRDAVAQLAARRFGTTGVVVGDGPQLVDYFGGLAERGVERVYAWFCDFAQPATLAAFGDTVIASLR